MTTSDAPTLFAFVCLLLCALGLLAWGSRCRFGYHPREGRMMRSGRTLGHACVAEWVCGRCLRWIDSTVISAPGAPQRKVTQIKQWRDAAAEDQSEVA